MVVPSVEIEFQEGKVNSEMSSATTHMRYILSKQKVLDLRTSSTFSAKLNDENIENYKNYDDLLNSFETITKNLRLE